MDPVTNPYVPGAGRSPSALVGREAAVESWQVSLQRTERSMTDQPYVLYGLPRLPQVLAEAKSYTDRFAFVHVERLDQPDAEAALVDPARVLGVEWVDQAVQCVTQASGRYPYFLQELGQQTWPVAHASPITADDAERGVSNGQANLDHGFFRTRWDRTTPKEKQYLRAMCPGGDAGLGSGEVNARLGRTGNQTGPVRAQLIEKGLIYAPEHGVVAFTVPGMEGFVTREMD